MHRVLPAITIKIGAWWTVGVATPYVWHAVTEGKARCGTEPLPTMQYTEVDCLLPVLLAGSLNSLCHECGLLLAADVRPPIERTHGASA